MAMKQNIMEIILYVHIKEEQMKNKSLKIAALCVVATMSIGAIAMAAQKPSETVNIEGMLAANKAEIESIADNLDSKLIEAVFKDVKYIDDDGEIQSTSFDSIDYSVNDIIKKYHVNDGSVSKALSEANSIYDSLSETYSYCIPLKSDDRVIGMAQLNIGRPVNEVKNILDGMSFKSEKTKEEILQRAREREGEWYVASVKKYDNDSLLDANKIVDIIRTAKITDIIDIKYISAGEFASDAICIKTQEDEFLIPLNSKTYLKDVDNGKAYSLSQVQNSLEAVDVLVKK